MLQPLRAFLAVAVAATAVPMHASADHGPSNPVRRIAGDGPIKNCTRLNGRMGYYGNPWCTPAEQALWDRWEARRILKR